MLLSAKRSCHHSDSRLALVLYFAAWWLLAPLGNGGLWMALIVFLAVRGALQALRYPALVRATFAPALAGTTLR